MISSRNRVPFISLLIALLAPIALSGQELPEQWVEEIESIPDSNGGPWVLGGQTFESTSETQVVPRYPGVVGNLAIVQFMHSGEKPVATQIMPLPWRAADIQDGPHVFWRDNKTAEVVAWTAGKTSKTTVQNPESTHRLDFEFVAGPAPVIDPTVPVPPPNQYEAPKRLLAISDLEGNYLNTLRFLQNNQVLDEAGHWDWGGGHLVLIGDLVDRGARVTELLWMIRRLELEATEAGGMVHYVLGNHEAMVMAGDLRYVHPKYHFVARRLGIPYDQLYGPTSEIGRWWRSKNGAERIGELLFVHAGYSPVLDQANLDLDTLNARIRQGLHPTRSNGTTAATNPVAHRHGPFWYRGYFDRHALQWGGKATRDQIQRVLDRHDVRHVVVGHTLVEQVGPLDESGQVIAIDVDWTQADRCQGLLLEDGILWRLSMTGEREPVFSGKRIPE